MKTSLQLLLSALCIFALITTSAIASEENAEQSNPILPGTIITTQNWQKYKQYMTDGLAGLFSGTFPTWKMPPGVQIVVGPFQSHPLPHIYTENTEKYANRVKIVNLPTGGHNIAGYVAGLPFPNPNEPMKGWKLLVDDWYAYQPYTICALNSHLFFEDRLHNRSTLSQIFLMRRMSHISDPGQPVYEPGGKGIDLVQYAQIEEPEEARYTTALNIYNEDLSKPEDSYLFIPALRRSLRLSTAARCSPFFGTDFTNDDTRHGAFNGSITSFDADYIGERSILEGAGYVTNNVNALNDVNNYYMPILFGKPSLGKWEVRPTWIIDVHRIPSMAAGYCYGKRILYVDKEVYQAQWADLYDANDKFWKVDYDPQGLVSVPDEGNQWTNTGWGNMWDVQSGHCSLVSINFQANQNCTHVNGVDYTNIDHYFSLSALSQVMR